MNDDSMMNQNDFSGSDTPPPPPPPPASSQPGSDNEEIEIVAAEINEAGIEAVQIEVTEEAQPTVPVDSQPAQPGAPVQPSTPVPPVTPAQPAQHYQPSVAQPPVQPAASAPYPTAAPYPAAGQVPGQIPGQAPGYVPAPGQMPMQMVPAGPSAFGLTWKAIWESPWKIWAGKSLEAFDMGQAPQRLTGNSWMMWLMTFLLNSLLAAFTLMAAARSSIGFIDNFISEITYGYRGYEISTGQYFQIFLVGLLGYFAFLILRVLALLITHRIYGAHTSFNETANYFASAQTLMWMPLAVLWLATLVSSSGLSLIVFLFFMGMMLMTEITTYISVLKAGPHRASPITGYTWFTVLAWLVSFGFHFVILSIFFE